MGDSAGVFIFRLNDHGQGPELIRQVFLERGWVEFDEDDQEEHDWNIWWRTSRFRQCDHDQLMPWQRLNHYPKATAITKKDSLARNLKRMKGVHGPIYNFSPIAFNLPNDYTRYVSEYSRLKEKNPDMLFWICKPADSSRGRGIFIFKDLGELQYDCSAVVQQYIPNPLLISGYKFDLRIYVIVSSFHPLNIYIYNEGLVRFSTEKFDLSSLKNVFSHLTNTSINKNSPSYATDKERIGPGCKWTLTQLRYYFRQIGIDDTSLFGKIINIVILTLLVQAQQVPKVHNCYELYGFDIIMDNNWKPWLLEVNFSPALSADSQVDILVKKPMLHDLIDILRFNLKDSERGGMDYQNERAQAAQLMSHLYPSYVPAPGVGRKFSIGGNVNRKPGQLTKKNSSSKFPSITNLQGNNGNGYNASHAGTAEADEGTSDFASKPVSSPEHQMVRLIPGCGLPSVQQAQQPYMAPGNYSEQDSGNSSHSSSDEEDGEEFIEEEIGDRTRVKSSTVLRRSIGNKSTSRIRDYRSDSEINQQQYSGNKNPIRSKKGISNASLYANRYRAPRELYKPNFKRVSKVSIASDSGISSYSGSSNSETGNTPPQYEHAIKASTKDLRHNQKKNSDRSHSRLNRIDYKDASPNRYHFTNEDDNRGIETTNTSMSNSKFHSNTAYAVKTVIVNNDHQHLTSDTTQRFSTDASISKDERLNRLSHDFRNKKINQLSFSADNLISATKNNKVGPIIRTPSQTSNHHTTSYTPVPKATANKRSNYSKPWRKAKPNEIPKTEPPKATAFNPAKTVGGFHLVFPFNDATKKCAQGSLDTKIVIKECQKFLKERIAKATVDRNNSPPPHSPSVRYNREKSSASDDFASSARSRRSTHFLNSSGEKGSTGNLSTTSTSMSLSSSRYDVSHTTVSARSTNPHSSLSSLRANSKTRISNSKNSSHVNSTNGSHEVQKSRRADEGVAISKHHSPPAHQSFNNLFNQEPQELWAPLKHLPKDQDV